MLNVLHLDDEEEICSVFADLFSSPQISIKSFTNARAAIEEVKKNPPDLIFLDYRLPGTNGEEVATEMNTKIPICLISGDITLKTNYAFSAVFKKPWKSTEIQAFLNTFIKS